MLGNASVCVFANVRPASMIVIGVCTSGVAAPMIVPIACDGVCGGWGTSRSGPRRSGGFGRVGKGTPAACEPRGVGVESAGIMVVVDCSRVKVIDRYALRRGMQHYAK